jgi:hypothetical protein
MNAALLEIYLNDHSAASADVVEYEALALADGQLEVIERLRVDAVQRSPPEL